MDVIAFLVLYVRVCRQPVLTYLVIRGGVLKSSGGGGSSSGGGATPGKRYAAVATPSTLTNAVANEGCCGVRCVLCAVMPLSS